MDEKYFVLVNLYNANIKKRQLNIMNKLSDMLKSVINIRSEQINHGGISIFILPRWKSYIKKIYFPID